MDFNAILNEIINLAISWGKWEVGALKLIIEKQFFWFILLRFLFISIYFF